MDGVRHFTPARLKLTCDGCGARMPLENHADPDWQLRSRCDRDTGRVADFCSMQCLEGWLAARGHEVDGVNDRGQIKSRPRSSL